MTSKNDTRSSSEVAECRRAGKVVDTDFGRARTRLRQELRTWRKKKAGEEVNFQTQLSDAWQETGLILSWILAGWGCLYTIDLYAVELVSLAPFVPANLKGLNVHSEQTWRTD